MEGQTQEATASEQTGGVMITEPTIEQTREGTAAKPTTEKAAETTATPMVVERADGSRLHIRRATRTMMAQLIGAANMTTTVSPNGSVTADVGGQLRYQELCIRWGIERIEGGPFADMRTTNHPALGHIAPEALYNDLTDDEVARIGDMVQG